jgi:hypothetical protein
MFPITLALFLYSELYKSREQNPVINPPRCPSHEIDFSPVISGLGNIPNHTAIDNYYCQGKSYKSIVFSLYAFKKNKTE